MSSLEPQRAARLYYLKFLRLKGDPHSLARGMTVGVAVGSIPILPLQTVVALALAPLFQGNSIASVLASLLISNPLTLLPQYYICWRIGNWLLPADLSWDRIRETVEFVTSRAGEVSMVERLGALGQLGYDYIAALLLGGAILAIPLVLLTYPLALRFFTAIRRRRRQKHVLS